MTKEQQKRAMILLKATHEILKKCDDSVVLENVMYMTAMYDETECDGNCLMGDISELIHDVE